MDTNHLSIITKILQENQTLLSQSSGQTMVIICGMVLTALLPTLTALAAYLKSKAALTAADKTEKVAVETASEVNKIHTAVNSDRTAMMEQMKGLRDEIKRMSEEKAALVERDRERGGRTYGETTPGSGGDVQTQILEALQELKKELKPRRG